LFWKQVLFGRDEERKQDRKGKKYKFNRIKYKNKKKQNTNKISVGVLTVGHAQKEQRVQLAARMTTVLEASMQLFFFFVFFFFLYNFF
jgi:hypothetical protein